LKVTFISILVIFVALISYGIAHFSATFNLNSCYASVIFEIQNDAKILSEKHTDDELKSFISRLEGIPVHGYESDCDLVTKYIVEKYAK
jgi:hypothetical protein